MLSGNRFFHLFLAHLWILLGRGNSDIIVRPVDTEVRVDDSTYLNCTISDPSESVNWYHQAVGVETHNQRIVYIGGHLMEPYDKRFEIRKDAGATSFSLFITNVKIQDAGTYVCHDVKTSTSVAAQLIVIEGDPTCLSNISPLGFIGPNGCGLKRDTILLSCSINFRGNVPSTLQWTRVKGGDSFPISDTLLTCSISDPIGNIVCNYTAESDIDYDGSFFICKTKVSGSNHYKCSTDLVKVHYAIDDKVSISKTVGESAVCTVRTSSLFCDYKWIWSDGVRKELISESSSLAISRGGWHQCKATCKFRDTDCTFDVLVVIALTETTVKNSEMKTTKVGTAIGVILFIGFICVLIFYLVIRVMTRRRRIAKKYKDGDPEESKPLATRKRSVSVKPVQIRKEFIFENLTFTKEFEEIKMIQTRANRIISGIALLNSKLYVTHEYYSAIEVYDSLTLDFERNLIIDESLAIVAPLDIASSESGKCLFISFLYEGQSRCQIRSLDVAGNTLHRWFFDGSDCRLSVYESNVIVCTTNTNQIIEYSSKGQKVFTVTLSSDDGFDKLLHAIRIAETQYAISYTVTGSDEHRMSIVERRIMGNDKYSAKILYSTAPKIFGMNKPICLVKERTNQILVADSLNNRVLRIHLSISECEVVIRDGRIKNLRSHCYMDHHPIRMCLDESRQKLFVAMGGSYLDAGIISTFREYVYDQNSSKVNGNKSVLAGKDTSYAKELGHVETIETKANLVISGIALLTDKLYVAHKNCSTIEVYNSTTFESSGTLELSNFLTNPLDITSSELQTCLYVVDLPNEQSQCRVKRLNADGGILNHWFIDDNEGRLSVYDECNVIACLPNRRQIIEYSPNGEVIFKVSLSPSDGFDKLWHAIKIADLRYAVSHKVTSSDEHRLTIVEKEIMANNLSSTRIVYYTSPKSCGMYTPICLVQDWKGHILVAEKLNNRVLLIDLASNTCEVILRNGCLKNIRSKCIIEHHPVRMCFDESSEKLFVAMEGFQLNTGSISIFRVQDTEST